jgi:hypothetical protein
MRHVVRIVACIALIAAAAAGTARAGDTGSRILDSTSRDVIHRNVPTLRSIVPGGNATTSRSLSGMIGELNAAGGSSVGGVADQPPSRAFDCVLHHERLERTSRQLFPSYCDPSADVDTGYPAFTTR